MPPALGALRRLQVLDLSRNRLAEAGPWLPAALPALRSVAPATRPSARAACRALRPTRAPRRYLALRDNALEHPGALLHMTRLRLLTLSGNPLPGVAPREASARPPRARAAPISTNS